MRRSIILYALFFLAPAVAFGDDYEVLREFKTVLWPQAYRTQDVKLLDRLLHDSFEMIDDEGNRSTKQKELEYIRNNQWDPGSFEYQIERLETYQGSFAVIDGTGVAEAYTYKSSNFLVKENGVWRAIASHVSGFESTLGPKAKVHALPETNGAFHAISVGDIDDSITWYTEHLGFTVESRGGNEQRQGALLIRPGTVLEIGQFADAVPRNQLEAGIESHEIFGVFKLGFTTANLDATFKALDESGVEVFFPIVEASDGNRTFGIKDPEGNIIQFLGE